MKILHLAYDCGGIHTRLYHDIISAYRDAGHEIVEAYLTDDVPANYATPAQRVVALRFPRKSLKGLRRLLAVKQLRAFLLEENFDVIITHRRKPAELAARASRGLNVQKRFAVWHDEGEFDRWSKCFGAARRLRDFTLIAVSDAVRDDMLASRAHFPPQQVIAINNAIDVTNLESHLLSRNDARATLALPADAFVFGNIGRLVPKKGQADLIRAFAALAPAHASAHLVVIGSGRVEAELHALVSELQLQGRVHLTGAIPQAYRYLAAFDTFVLPSYREGLPIALLEAACARLSMIASDIGGNRAVIAGVGVLIAAGDIAALSRAMTENLLLPVSVRKAQGDAIYQRLRESFDRPVMLAAYRRLLDQV